MNIFDSLGCNVAYGLLHKIPTKSNLESDIPAPETLPESVIGNQVQTVDTENNQYSQNENKRVEIEEPTNDKAIPVEPINSSQIPSPIINQPSTHQTNYSAVEKFDQQIQRPRTNLPSNYAVSQPNTKADTFSLPPASASQTNVSDGQSMDLEALKLKQQKLKEQLAALNQSMNN